MITNLLRKYLIGSDQEFIFFKVNKTKLIPKIKEMGVYIHIPFCKTLCPYCPYNRVKYHKDKAKSYVKAILKEIDIYYQNLGKITISSVYIGGGTPTSLIDELGIILNKIKSSFSITGDICLETNVSDINKKTVKKLKDYGINCLSIGVQSFHNKYLRFLGRNYKKNKIEKAIKVAQTANFKSTNIDLMFSLPSQSIKDILSDLKKAIQLDVDQITMYPLFTFPYTTIGKYLKLKHVKMPNIFTRRRQYKAIHNYLVNQGYERVSVWGFKKGKAPRYSSVTRNFYIGFGAGAASNFPDLFSFNTFSIDEYIKTLTNKKLPVSIKMNISDKLSKYYWFYWKLYDTYFTKQEIQGVFSKKSKIWIILKLMKIFRLINMVGRDYELTERGSFWVHLAQNYFMLDYINKVWTISMKNPWPKKIKI